MNTAAKRRAAVNVGCVWRGFLPQPDATVDQSDRAMLTRLYSTTVSAEPGRAVSAPAVWLY
jgi:hypothetical protein